MIELELRTKVAIDHKSYGLKFIEVDAMCAGRIRYTYKGKFEQISPELKELIESDIVVAAQKEIISNRP